MICDGKADCVDGSDEIGCEDYACIGMYRCLHQQKCIPVRQRCDNRRDCLHGDDELMCDIACPSYCVCVGLSYFCAFKNVIALTSDTTNRTGVSRMDNNSLNFQYLNYRARSLDLRGNKIELMNRIHLPLLGSLDLSFNEITDVPIDVFSYLNNLYHLDLQNNYIDVIQRGAFNGLYNVMVLKLLNNPLQNLDSYSFEGLNSLPMLNLSRLHINILPDHAFSGLASLQFLDLSHNVLKIIHMKAFQDLSNLTSLNMTGNVIAQLSRISFNSLPRLNTLFTDDYKYCCFVKDKVRITLSNNSRMNNMFSSKGYSTLMVIYL